MLADDTGRILILSGWQKRGFHFANALSKEKVNHRDTEAQRNSKLPDIEPEIIHSSFSRFFSSLCLCVSVVKNLRISLRFD